MRASIKCIIVDDEPLAVALLKDYVSKHPTLELVWAGTDVLESIKILNKENIDLVFIDLQMPQLNGLELMSLFNENHHFIITSAYSSYALEAFQYKVIDFLLKPITFQRFHQSVEKFIQWFPKKEESTFLFVKADRKHFQIAFENTIYIEGLKDYIRIYTDEESIMVLETMKEILDKLPPTQFIRIHRSYILSINRIKEIEGNSIKLKNGVELPIGETYKNTVKKLIE